MKLERFSTVSDAIAHRKSDLPLLCFRPQMATARTADFVRRFPGTVAYAIKVQPDEMLLHAIASGMKAQGKRVAFDVASLEEIELTRRLFPDSELFFMHPMKKLSAIRNAYHDYGVRHFVVDHPAEFEKFGQAQVGKDSTILVRIATPRSKKVVSQPAYNLSDKFGASPKLAVTLLRAISGAGYETGIAIHAGSQIASAIPWQESIDLALNIRKRAGIKFRYLDVGGGFPGRYRDTKEAAVDAVSEAVFARLKELKALGFELIAEPGRALVYDSVSVVCEIVGRKESTLIGLTQKQKRSRKKRVARPTLYIDDGVWSTLSESLTAEFGWPIRPYMRSPGGGRKIPYYIGGVTCDSCDVLSGEYELPATIGIGDLIEFGNIGAYGSAIASHFNGFGKHECVVIDEPFQSDER